jgi:uncharacterized membrane protein YhaH (DUF805 family)
LDVLPVGVLLGVAFLWVWYRHRIEKEIYFLLLYPAYCLLTVCPRLAVTWRRYHDMNKSGLNIFWGLVPVVGPFIVLISLAASGTKGPNNYGLDPLDQPVADS